MTSLWVACAALHAAVVALAWAAAKQRPDHRPVAALLGLGLVVDVVREAIQVNVLQPARAATGFGPFGGAARIAFGVDEVLFLAWPAGLAACTLWIFLNRRPWAVAPVYGIVAIAVAGAYPALRGATLARVYFGVELAAIAIGVGSFITWAWKRRTPNLTTGILFLVVAIEIATLLPFRKGPFAYWPMAQASYLTFYVVLIMVYGGVLWGRGSSSPSSSR
jgi:hypothetical protein